MLIVNALRYAEHSRAGHYIAGRTNHRFVRYITASTTCKIVVRHWRLEPSTTLITDFTCAFPATGLARLPQCQSGIWKTQGSKGGQYVLRKFWPSGVVVPSNHVACQSNPVTGTCSCPGNTVDYGYMTGQSKLYDSFDTFFETHFCIER